MRYLFRSGEGAKRRVMHVQKHTIDGRALFEPLCDTPGPFNRSINVPLRRPICKKCEAALRARQA